MKKGIAFLAALCMLLMASFSAFAEETAGRSVIQNEQPPMLVVTEGTVATIYDANGSVIGSVSDDGSLELVDVHHRNTIEAEEVAKRLTSAYEWAMFGVHYSDVESLKHDDVLKVDIDAAVKSMDLIAHDLMMYELFDAMLYGEAAALLADGAYVEFTVQLEQDQSLPLLILFTPDGENWKILENWIPAANNCVTIRLEEPGTLAFLLHGAAVSEADGSSQMDEIILPTPPSEDEPDDNFTPSVSGKPAPSIVPDVDEEGDVYVASIHDYDDTQVARIPAKNYLIVTPVSERDYVVDIQTHEHLEWSYDDILAAETYEDLQPGIGAEIDAILKNNGFELTHADMVIRDLFEITVYGEYLNYFYTEGAYLKITFKEALTANDPLVVLFSSDSVNWHTLPAEDAQINANGTLTLHLEELGTVAIMVKRPEVLPAAEEAVTSPE